MISSMGVAGSFEGFFRHQHQLESATRVLHFVLGRFDSGIEVVVRKQAGDGDEKTEGGGDQTFRDAPCDGGRGSQLVPTHHAEGVHHAGHRAEQSEEWCGGDDGVQDGQAAAEPLQFEGAGLADGVADRKFGIGECKTEHACDEVGGGLRDPDGSRTIPVFDQGEDLLHLRRILAPFFRHNEKGPLQRDNRSHDRGKKQGPHDRTAVDEGADDRVLVSVISQGLTHGEVRGDDCLPSGHEGGKGRAKDFRVFRTFEYRFLRSLGLRSPTCD